jgi:SAM-dependent methyltransferase
MPSDLGELPLTGERTAPGIWHENYWFRRHEAAYAFATGLVRGRVLEIGCGEGYGAARLAETASALLAIDYDALTIRHAARTYRRTQFARANLAALPVRDATIDLVVSLQVIEHVWLPGQFLGECHRVLAPGGRLLLSTPNRLTFSPDRDAPTNLFHTHEFTAAELVDLLRGSGYTVETLLGLHAAARLRALDAHYGGSFAQAQLAAPPEQWDGQLRRDVAGVSVADFEISGSDPDAALDLIVLAGPVTAGAAHR